MFRSLFKQPTVSVITPDKAQDRQQAGALIIDVRELDEWREGHIPGALHIPLGSLSAHVNEIDRNSEVIVVCRSGARSGRAVAALMQSGYTQVANLSGGMIAWARLNLPVTRR
jgi:rhodanese-related sulfurtransferase